MWSGLLEQRIKSKKSASKPSIRLRDHRLGRCPQARPGHRTELRQLPRFEESKRAGFHSISYALGFRRVRRTGQVPKRVVHTGLLSRVGPSFAAQRIRRSAAKSAQKVSTRVSETVARSREPPTPSVRRTRNWWEAESRLRVARISSVCSVLLCGVYSHSPVTGLPYGFNITPILGRCARTQLECPIPNRGHRETAQPKSEANRRSLRIMR